MYLNKIIKALPNRILSAMIDQISLAVSSFLIFSIGEELASTPQEMNMIDVNAAITLCSIFLNKDIYFGKSIGKHFIGLRVLSSRTGNAASPIQCLIRNLFLFLWPLEALILFFSPKRRIGDMVAGTKVEESKEIRGEKQWPYVQVILSIVGSFILVYYLFNFIDNLGIMH
jgi:uncharacterized RDD family membrane protein YckC